MTTRREQVREAIARHRKRRKRGFFWRPILVTKAQLDQLEERGYLNPSDRGTRRADAGCSAHEIAAWSGHITLKEVERYTKSANQKRLAVNAMARMANK